MGPCHLQDSLPDLFFYGIHGIEVLFSLLGSNFESVERIHSDSTDIVVGKWPDSQIGVFRGMRRGHIEFGMTVYGTRSIRTVPLQVPYRRLCRAIAKFFLTGKSPVSLNDTIKMLSFMQSVSRRSHAAGVTDLPLGFGNEPHA